MTKWTFEWITDWETIWSDDFTQKWHTWLKQSWSSHVFFHPALVKAWVKTYMPLWNISPLFLIAKHDEMIVFLPLVLWKRNWKNAFLREIIPIGHSDFDYHDPIIIGSKEQFYNAKFWSALSVELKASMGKHFDVVNIPGIREQIIETGTNWLTDDLCPHIDISNFESIDDFLHILKKKKRLELKRRTRKLEQVAPFEFIIINELDRALETLAEMITVHSERWPNAYKAPGFHANLIRYGLESNTLHFSIIKSKNTIISWRLGFIFKDCYYSYMPSFRQEYYKFSPGSIHLSLCIEDAIKQNLKTYDQLRGNELYKNGWATHHTNLHTLKFYANHNSLPIKKYLISKVKPLLVKA